MLLACSLQSGGTCGFRLCSQGSRPHSGVAAQNSWPHSPAETTAPWRTVRRRKSSVADRANESGHNSTDSTPGLPCSTPVSSFTSSSPRYSFSGHLSEDDLMKDSNKPWWLPLGALVLVAVGWTAASYFRWRSQSGQLQFSSLDLLEELAVVGMGLSAASLMVGGLQAVHQVMLFKDRGARFLKTSVYQFYNASYVLCVWSAFFCLAMCGGLHHFGQ